MARFHYALQPALDAAVDVERDEKYALGVAERAVSIERSQLARLDEQAQSVRGRIALLMRVPASVYVEFDQRLEMLAAARRRQTDSLAEAIRESAIVRGRLALASQRRKAIERHRERRREVFDAELERREAADLDESNALAHAARTIRASS